MCKKKKPKTLNRRKLLYSTDNIMYGFFSAIVVLIIAIAFALLRLYSNCVSSLLSSDIIGLISGVLSGLLASVIVAWLLDLASCKRKNEMLKKAVDDDLSNLKKGLDELFQAMRDSLSFQGDKGGLKFEPLFKLFVEQYSTSKNTDPLEEASIRIYVYINLIIATIDKLTTGEEKEYLLTMFSDADSFLILNKSMYDLRENLFNNGNLSYDFIYTGIFNFLSTVLLYVDLRSKEYNVPQVKKKEKPISNKNPA